jgi:hypothetical protein
MHNRAWVTQLSRGLTVPTIQEYLRIWDLLQDVQLNDEEDRLIWRWTVDGTYTSRFAYRALHSASHPTPGCDRLWGTWAPLRVKIFLWIAPRSRHWTADRRARHGLDANEHYFLCDQEPETIDHIIASCSFSKQVWWNILARLGANAALIGGESILAWWESWRLCWNGDKRKGADSLFTLVAWELWKERKAVSTIPQVLLVIQNIANQWIEAAASNLGCLVRE